MSFKSMIIRVIAVILAMGIHEMAHGLVSYWFGDPTAKKRGRLTLNPLAHVDWLGLVCLLLFGFGWAKPVPVDPSYYKNPKTGMIWTAFAGPMANFLLAFFSILSYYVFLKIGLYHSFLLSLLSSLSILSTGFGIFNLLPIPPLDGSKIVFAFLPDDQYFRVVRGSQLFLLLFLIIISTGVLNKGLLMLITQFIDIFSAIARGITGI